ncbi:hypothetical protein TEA_011793 [Camellia sinensis var. sinensis]|uniref:Pentacotripeptide-repeat region of PRORP domain-containing protein n=1 Tax=Camellia sinensis var. sinensis TaxID=542762 RepID=A0A4S4EFB0_CAMSN|nr:hypothetical protein TEA_011793 [Camellia sinensis var. sinensis]
MSSMTGVHRFALLVQVQVAGSGSSLFYFVRLLHMQFALLSTGRLLAADLLLYAGFVQLIGLSSYCCMLNLLLMVVGKDVYYSSSHHFVLENPVPILNIKSNEMHELLPSPYEKNIHSALMVLKHMENADVKTDSRTFSYLIGNCDREEDIVKYYEELKHSGVQITKYIFMALTNAYVACGQFEKAKQIVFDKGITVKSLNEIKSVLVSPLASHGQISDALIIYDEIKQAKCYLEPKAIMSYYYWVDGCFRVILYCVRYKHLSSTVDLLKQLKDKFYANEVATDVLFDEAFSLIAETDPVDLQFGLNMLKAIKDELNICPSRKSHEFLLSACALLASGDHKSATNMLNKIPKDDPHVRCVIKASQATYIKPTSSKEKKAMEMVRK